ncbi:alpha/beta fold hydrolase [Paenibacillus alvei]|uniref:alpha/beta fold hydrolase n=1 Tax=Paenibacillus alvei TaxID=44250 RepID=UPI00227F706F|nr:alpha/beta hydrolase [Paenibacillus alvei]
MKLHYTESGNTKASLIVFLHGGGVSGWMWAKQIEYFKDYHCLVPDLPGHGKSPCTDFSIQNCAEEILNLILTKAQGKKVILIGFSLGAQVAMEILSMNPDIVDYSIINSVLVRPAPFVNKMIQPAIRLTYGLTKNRTFSKLQAKQLYIGEEMFETYYKETSNMDMNLLIQILEENMSFRIPTDFSKSTAKILITVGEKEKKMMRKSLLDIVDNTIHCKGIIIPNVGHGVSLAQPELFNKIVEAWINDRELPYGLTLVK